MKSAASTIEEYLAEMPEDRRQAIRTACKLAEPEDIILVAGKGHETYQEIKGVRSDFNDYQIVKEELEKQEAEA